MKEKKLTEADKFTKEVNNTIDEAEFERYGDMMLRRFNQAEAGRIAEEMDETIMNLGTAYINIKVKKVDLPDDLVKFVNSGVKIVEELKEYKKEIECLKEEVKAVRWKARLDGRDIRELIYQLKETSKELMKVKNKADKLDGDLEHAKCSGWLNTFVYPTTIEYPIMTYNRESPFLYGEVAIDDVFKTVV